jgi:hypothetical protein
MAVVVAAVAVAYSSLLVPAQQDDAFESMRVMKIKLMSNNYVSFHRD